MFLVAPKKHGFRAKALAEPHCNPYTELYVHPSYGPTVPNIECSSCESESPRPEQGRRAGLRVRSCARLMDSGLSLNGYHGKKTRLFRLARPTFHNRLELESAEHNLGSVGTVSDLAVSHEAKRLMQWPCASLDLE